MIVKTVRVKLRTNEELEKSLEETMIRFNEVCNRLSTIAWDQQTFRQFELHDLGYHLIRKEFDIPAQLVIRAIAKVTDSYKTERSTKHVFGQKSAVVFDARCFKMHGISSASLTTTQGRKKFSLAHGGKQSAQLSAGTTGEADLLFVDGVYYLSISVKFPDPPKSDMSQGFLGVDLGIVELATDSEGESFSGDHTKAVRRRVREHRRQLQKKKTRSSYKRLQKISRRVSRFTKDVNHVISKSLVAKAVSLKKALVLEDLTGIRDRGNGFNKEMRFQLGSWSFFDLASKIVYKAKDSGIDVVFVDPRNTSRTCSSCEYCDKDNRRSQSRFECLNCGLVFNADFNAALNIKTWAKCQFA